MCSSGIPPCNNPSLSFASLFGPPPDLPRPSPYTPCAVRGRWQREAREATEEALGQVQAQLAEAQGETAAAEESVQAALTAKNEELEEVRLRLGQSQRESAELQGRLAALEVSGRRHY